METKTYNIQGESFRLQANTLAVKKYGARLIARIRKLAYEYTKDTDFTVLEKYNERKQELNTAKSQIQELIDSNTDEQGYELTEENKQDYRKRINEYDLKLSGIDSELKNDTEAQRIIKLKAELESLAMVELLADIEFLKEILDKLLKDGDIKKIDFSTPEARHFMTEVIYDFFCSMSGNVKK